VEIRDQGINDFKPVPRIDKDVCPPALRFNVSVLIRGRFEGAHACRSDADDAAAVLPRFIDQLRLAGFDDVERINGSDLIEKIGDAVGRYGLDDIVVLCRSNKRANRYNAGIRSAVLYREERLTRDDKLMVVKNCYQFLDDIPELDFIANGDVAQLVKVSHHEERYGLHFADAVLAFPDYNDVEVRAKIILDTLDSEQPSLSAEQQRMLYEGVNADYADVRGARKRYEKVREDPYFNALQIKYATAITGHKSQGGQWRCVFIDNPFWKELTMDDLKWLYTAITRGVESIFFVNFRDEFFEV
jgi:exodeoxyribonuclease-5